MTTMWRLCGLFANTPVDATAALGLEHTRAADAKHGPGGWGMAFYQQGIAYLVKKASGKYNPDRFAEITNRVRTNALVAHLRTATVGEVKEANTHPFRYGAWVYAQHGTIENFRRIKPLLLKRLPQRYREHIGGNTDAEHCFYLFLTHLRGHGYIKRGDIAVEHAAAALRDTARQLEAWSVEVGAEIPWGGTVLITNGRYMLATCKGSRLYYYVYAGKRVPVAADADDPTASSPAEPRAVLIATDRPFKPTAWKAIPAHSLVVIDAAAQVSLSPLLK